MLNMIGPWELLFVFVVLALLVKGVVGKARSAKKNTLASGGGAALEREGKDAEARRGEEPARVYAVLCCGNRSLINGFRSEVLGSARSGVYVADPEACGVLKRGIQEGSISLEGDLWWGREQDAENKRHELFVSLHDTLYVLVGWVDEEHVDRLVSFYGDVYQGETRRGIVPFPLLVTRNKASVQALLEHLQGVDPCTEGLP